MDIAIGTTRKPKVDGIMEGFLTCPYFEPFYKSISFLPHEVSSGISHTPLTIEEVMQGAYNRVQDLLTKVESASFYVGVEGGVWARGTTSYLFGCVYVQNEHSVGHYGFSPMVEVPAIIHRMLYEEGRELGPIMGELSGVTDIRSENGSMGAWTNDMFTRKDEFVLAFRAAIAPFFNKYYALLDVPPTYERTSDEL